MLTLDSAEAHCLIPFRRNKQFVGRDSQLRELMAKLSPENEDDCQRVAIAGLGGIGKTQIALEIAFRMQEAFTDCSVFWVPAIDITSFEKAYRDIGKILQIPGLDDDKADVKSLVAAYMGKESMGRWLLVIDNVDDLELFSQKAGDGDESGSTTFADYLPFSRKGSILFTTRNRVVAIKQAEVEVAMVDEMDQTDSQKLLEVSLINKDCSEQKNNVAKLLDLLAYLPLAIKQAAAFMNENQMSIATYLDICVSDNERFVELLSKDFEDKGRYKTIKNPIALTWLISFRQVLSHDHLAAEYLYFMSCVAQQDILQSLLPEASRLKQEMALGLLKAYAFITQREGQKSFDIHRLVQIAIRNWLREKNELHIWTGRTLTRMTELFPPFDYKKREECAKYLPHAEYILDFTQFSPDFGDDLEELLFKVGEYFHKIGKYVKAEQRYRRRFMMMTEMLGAEHPDTLGSMANLGLVLRSLTQYDEAEQIHRKCLKLNMEALGANHRNTLRSMNNLAVVLSVRGKHREAEQMHRKNLKLNIEMLGEDHPNTLRSMNNLAMVLDKQGSNAEAEGLMRQRLKLKEQTIGINHPSTLGSMNNLALILKKQGKYEESEKLHRHTLKLTEEVLGADHPDTIRSMNNLGSVLMKQGNYKEAESMNRQVLKLKEQAFGPDHPDTLRSLKNLSISLEKQGKHDVLGENV
jgi:tetratricopeptide (TPR) repeat protein